MRPLEGVKVIELSMVISAPSAGKALVEMGADVIKVETSKAGDNWRVTPGVYAMPTRPDECPGFESLNSGKRFVLLNLKDPADMERMKKLICGADVFVSNFRKKALEGMGLGYEALKALKPDLIYASISGYGDKGPRKDDPGYDNTSYWAETGVMRDLIIASEEGNDLPMNGPVGGGDTVVGAWIAGGVAAALYKREKTGEGTYLTCPLYGAGIWAFAQQSLGTQYGYTWPRKYTQMPPTNNPYITADGDIIMTSMSKYDEQWPKFCYAFGMEDLADHPVYSKRANTVALEPRAACVKEIASRVKQCHTADAVRRLKEADLVYCVMPHMADNYSSVQAIENGDIVPFTYASGKSIYMPKPPVRFDGQEALPHKLCGVPGADNEEVFKEFGIE